MNKKPTYLGRDFQTLKSEIVNFARTYFPDLFAYVNDNNPDMLYFETLAYIGDVLSFYTDKTFNEQWRELAQARSSLFRIANDLGFKQLGPSSSVVPIKCSIRVPAIEENGVLIPNPDYLLSIAPGMTLVADNGTLFEVTEEIIFANPRNRVVIPNVDTNNAVIDFTVEKQVIAIAGEIKYQRFYVSPSIAQPFLNITLEDQDVVNVEGVIELSGNVSILPNTSLFYNPELTYVEVKNLTDKDLFVPSNADDIASVTEGQWIAQPRRFITTRDVNGLVTLLFGNNNPDLEDYLETINNGVVDSSLQLSQIINNTELGRTPSPNSTLFIKYRTGGGAFTNISANQINTIVSRTFTDIVINDLSILQEVRNSLSVRNELPAIGGKDEPTNEEIRQASGKVFAMQDRGVTYEDIKALISEMPPQFGRPFRIAYEEVKPRVASYYELKGALEAKLTQIESEPSYVSRLTQLNEIRAFLNEFQSGVGSIQLPDNTNLILNSEETTNLLQATPSLWLGEKNRLYIIGQNELGQLTSLIRDQNNQLISPNELLKTNIKNYLLKKRIAGDWIDIVDGRINNIQIEFTVLVDRRNKQQVLIDCLNRLKEYFNINNWQMNQPIYITNVEAILQELTGVISVVEVKFYNIFGKDPQTGKVYSEPEIGRYRLLNPSQIGSASKYEMLSDKKIIKGFPDTIFEVKYPSVDIIGNAI